MGQPKMPRKLLNYSNNMAHLHPKPKLKLVNIRLTNETFNTKLQMYKRQPTVASSSKCQLYFDVGCVTLLIERLLYLIVRIIGMDQTKVTCVHTQMTTVHTQMT